MTTHISARLAWHDNGWNGHICRHPSGNVYCVGQHSFPGQSIADTRDLQWEESVALQPASAGQPPLPPCTWSINAFGASPITGYTDPPEWFRDNTQRRMWQLPPYTIATWPYEEMYKDEVHNQEDNGRTYDAVARREAARQFFSQIEPDHSLIFYYANYSNPFNEDEHQRYVVVGVSRIRLVGDEITWQGQSERMATAYGANIWARNITSHYPDQGIRIPYHLYVDQPEVLNRLLLVPENSRLFKYATRHISDDEALGLIERFQQIVAVLIEIGDTSENWQLRANWLSSIIAELWESRGRYPGLLRVLDYLQFAEAIPYAKAQLQQQDPDVVKDTLFQLITGEQTSLPELPLGADRVNALRKRWRLLTPEQQQLLRDLLPRFDLRIDQIQRIIDKPTSVSITSTHVAIIQNPFKMAEEYVGIDPDDSIAYSKIERGVYPSPELGVGLDWPVDDWRRLQALCVEQLRQASQHTFLGAQQVIDGLNHKLATMPDWKRFEFNIRYLDAYAEELRDALIFRQDGDILYLYRRSVYEAERLIEQTLRQLATRPDIRLKRPVTEGDWRNLLIDSSTEFATRFPTDYAAAIDQQVAVCQRIFLRPISVLCGAAGTGKTTIVKAIISAVEKAHGTGASFQLLAPTGKAADRLRDRTGKPATTIHAFLTRLKWLNENMTFGIKGNQEDSITTYILDESSMLDLELLAAFFRAVNWNSVQRLIFVGDASQLPPIGIGRPFADMVDWLEAEVADHVGMLETNIRQIQNQLTGKGTGIIDLASLYIRRPIADMKLADTDASEETLLQQLAEGGDVTGDLRVVYWDSPEELADCLISTIAADIEADTGKPYNYEHPELSWNMILNPRDPNCDPESLQIISPYRGEEYGVDHINRVIQQHRNGTMLADKGHVGRITIYDKVIQTRNRTGQRALWGWDDQARKRVPIDIFNGEIGVTRTDARDLQYWQQRGYHIGRFQVGFTRKPGLWVNFGSERAVTDNLELAYAISVHRFQGSECSRLYFILPKHKRALLSREMAYTGMTRARSHLTLFIQEDLSPILALRRPESSQLARINSSLFRFAPAPLELQLLSDWYEEGKIHRTLIGQMVRSKSEVIIANMLTDRGINPHYEKPLVAPDGTFYLPDFTIQFRGETWYWEHFGMLSNPRYKKHNDEKLAWYQKHGFSDSLIITEEGPGFDSQAVAAKLQEYFGLE